MLARWADDDCGSKARPDSLASSRHCHGCAAAAGRRRARRANDEGGQICTFNVGMKLVVVDEAGAEHEAETNKTRTALHPGVRLRVGGYLKDTTERVSDGVL